MSTGPLRASAIPEPDETPLEVIGVGATLGRIASTFARHPGYGLVILLALLLEMGFTGLIPMSFKHLIDEGIAKNSQSTLVWTLSALMGALALVSLTSLGRDYLYAKVVSLIQRDLRRKVFSHLQELSLSFHRRGNTADVVSCFSIDLAAIEHAVSAVVPWVVLPMLDILMSTVLMFMLDWRLALVAMLIWPLSMVGPKVFSRRASLESYRYKLAEAELVSHVQDNLDMQVLIKQFGLGQRAVQRFREITHGLAGTGLRVSFLSAVVERSANIGISFLQVLTIGVGAYLALRGEMSVGTLVSFQALLLTLSNSVSYVINYVPILVPASGAMQHLDDLLAERPGVPDVPAAPPAPSAALSWAMQDVTFRHPARDAANRAPASRTPASQAPASDADSMRPALRNVSFELPSGSMTALVGSSGSGKSTILNLLLRFEDPETGVVTLDGADLRGLAQDSVRAQISLMTRDPLFFPTTLGDNLRLAAPGTDEPAWRAACEAAGVLEAIAALPQGFETPLEGLRFSPLEWQRFALARALARKPRLLILDEATGALDAQAEHELLETVRRAAAGCTVLVATPRLATVEHADQILVLVDGELVERGTHEALCRQAGAYARMWQKQSGFIASGSGSIGVQPERLAQLGMFESLEPSLLAEMASRFQTERFPANRVVFHEGDRGERFYLIARGSVEVLRATPEGGTESLARLEDGDPFGEVALTTDAPRSATIRTLTPCELVTLAREDFLELLARDAAFESRMTRLVAERTGNGRLI